MSTLLQLTSKHRDSDGQVWRVTENHETCDGLTSVTVRLETPDGGIERWHVGARGIGWLAPWQPAVRARRNIIGDLEYAYRVDGDAWEAYRLLTRLATRDDHAAVERYTSGLYSIDLTAQIDGIGPGPDLNLWAAVLPADMRVQRDYEAERRHAAGW